MEKEKIALCVSGVANAVPKWNEIFDELESHDVTIFVATDFSDLGWDESLNAKAEIEEHYRFTKYTTHRASVKLTYLLERFEVRNNMNFDAVIKYDVGSVTFDDGWFSIPRRADEVSVVPTDNDGMTVINNLIMRKVSFDFFYARSHVFKHLMCLSKFNYASDFEAFSSSLRNQVLGEEYYFYYHIKRLGYHCVMNDKVKQ